MQPERVPGYCFWGYCFWGPYFSVRPSRRSSALRYRLRSAAGCLAVLVSDLLSSATTRAAPWLWVGGTEALRGAARHRSTP